MPLSDMYRYMLEANNPANWENTRQKQLMGQYELEEKARSLSDAQKLRDLYASGQDVTYEKAAAIDPLYAQKMQQFNNEQLLKQYQMLESEGKIQENRRKDTEAKQHTFANTLGVGVENWLDSLGGRQPTQQDIEAFKPQLGGMIKFIDETYGYKPDVPIDPYHPEQILSTAERLGYASRRSKAMGAQQEAYAGGVGRAQAPVPAGVHMTPQGPMVTPGLPTGMPSAPDLSKFGPATKATSEDIPMLEEAYASEKNPSVKNQIGRMLNELKQQPQFVTPQEASQMRVSEEKQKEEVKQEMQEKGAAKKATMAYEMLPSPDRIRNLIKGSISGDIEYWTNRLGGTVGKSLASGDMTGALKVIEGQMADTVAMFPGAQSDKELEARMKTIGDPSANISSDTRLAAFDEWLQRMQKYATQHAAYDDTQLIDMVSDGKLTADQAMQIRKKRMSGGM